MQSIRNPDRQSAEFVRGVVRGIRFRVRASGIHMADWVVLDIHDHAGDLHELRFASGLFDEVGGIAKLDGLQGAEVVGITVRTEFFGAPGGPLVISQEAVFVVTGVYAGQLLELQYQTNSLGRTYAGVAGTGHFGVHLNGRAPAVEIAADRSPRLFPESVRE